MPGGNVVFSSQQLFEVFPLASETIESLLGVIFLYVWAEEGWGEMRWAAWRRGVQLVSGERVFTRRGFKVLASASSVAQTDDINDG